MWLPKAPATARQRRPAAPKPAPKGKLRKLKILLVDDHSEVRSTTAAVLEDSGHQVLQAGDGAEALQVLEDNGCDCELLITDYAMPHVSGTEFIRKAREVCPDVPALIITGYAETDAIGDRPDGVEILLKPFTPVALESAIARVAS